MSKIKHTLFNKSVKISSIFRSVKPDGKYNTKQLKQGIKVELEHTDKREIAKIIAKHHLDEIPDYYTRLIEMEEEAERE